LAGGGPMRDERIRGVEAELAIACIQFAPRICEKELNVKRSCELLRDAAERGARLCVLPELASSGYVFNRREEAYAVSESVPGGEATEAWTAVARERGIYVVAGVAEREGVCLYNTAVLIGPEGYVGKYRKMHLWHEEKLFFEPGDLGFPVYKTEVGRVGMAICYDLWFPESLRLMAVQGADLVCVPTNWVPVPGHARGERPMAVYLCMAAAHCNGLFVAAADRVGRERGQEFLGNSVIVGPSGSLLAGPASDEREETLIARCNVSDARRSRNWNELNQVLRDRRTDYYSETLGAPVQAHAF
jgi:N-carbamoylputrescine amidase